MANKTWAQIVAAPPKPREPNSYAITMKYIKEYLFFDILMMMEDSFSGTTDIDTIPKKGEPRINKKLVIFFYSKCYSILNAQRAITEKKIRDLCDGSLVDEFNKVNAT